MSEIKTKILDAKDITVNYVYCKGFRASIEKLLKEGWDLYLCKKWKYNYLKLIHKESGCIINSYKLSNSEYANWKGHRVLNCKTFAGRKKTKELNLNYLTKQELLNKLNSLLLPSYKKVLKTKIKNNTINIDDYIRRTN